MALESIPGYCAYRGGAISPAYNEAAFRYFLAVERSRVERSQRPMFLVLVSVRRTPGRSAVLAERTAAAVFAGLAAGVREVDFVGWYREGRIAGAVLPQGADSSGDLRGPIAMRILSSLRTFLPAEHSRHLHVRVVRLGRKDR